MRFVATTLLHRWLLPLLSGALLMLAYPPFNVSQLGWLAFVPLLFAVEHCRPGEAFRRGYTAGLLFFGATVWWIIHVSLPGMVALIAFLALYFGVGAMWFAACLSVNRSLSPSPRLRGEGAGAGRPASPAPADSVLRNLLIAVVASAGWVMLEWVRGWLLFGGFGWNGLGVSQHQVVPLIQFASVTGVYGVSALVCFVNIAFFFTVRRFVRKMTHREPLRRLSWEFYAAMILSCATFLHGLRLMRHDEPTRTLRLALVQGNIPQSLKFDPHEKPMILERYRQLTELTVAGKPELIIWPETATPEAMRYDIESFSLVTNLAQQANAYLLTGTIDVTPMPLLPEAFNTAMLVRPDGTLDRIYRKIHLVAFGEYVPLRKLVPFMKWLTPITDSFERGREFTIFEVDDYRFGAVICFEDTLPDLYRRFVKRGVDFMVNVTNDAWFKDSPAAEMHLANAVFRCAETRRPLVRCTNNGVTCIVSRYGAVPARTRLPAFAEGSLNCELELLHSMPEETFYTRHGDWFVGVCAAVSGVALVVAWRRRGVAVKSPA